MTITYIRDDDKCANCGLAVTGSFCASCGQRANTIRLDLGALVTSAFRAMLEFDSKIWNTLRDLTLMPGQTALNFINGSRVAYINPVKYFLTAFAIGFAVSVLTGEFAATIEFLREQQAQSIDPARAEVAEILGPYFAAQQDIYIEMVNVLTFLAVPLFAFFLRLQNFRAGKNYAEILCFACFVWGHIYIIGVPLTLIGMLVGYFSVWAKMIPLLGLYYYGSKVFFGRSWLRNIISTIAAAFFFFLSVQIVLNALTLMRLKGII